MEDHELKSAIEALLFVSGNPLSLDRLKGIFDEIEPERIESQLQALQQGYVEREAGIMLAEVAGGFQLATRPEHFPWIRKFKSAKISTKLSKPALETLAIVAYKQPITRTEVEAVRGVNIGGIMRNLMERRLVKIVGKKDVPGKPMMYGTTPEFLQYFGLKDLSALPTLKEFQELEAGEDVMEQAPDERPELESDVSADVQAGAGSGEETAVVEDTGSSAEDRHAPPPEDTAAEEEESEAPLPQEAFFTEGPESAIDDQQSTIQSAAAAGENISG